MYNEHMSRKAPIIELTPEEITTIESWARSGKTEQRTAFRGRIILAANKGKEIRTLRGIYTLPLLQLVSGVSVF